MIDLKISDFDYELPENRIAQYPVKERDASKLLIFDGTDISYDVFRNLDKYLPGDSLLVFNNTRVIKARLLFQKESGAEIEILCLEPLSPPSYEMSFASHNHVDWKCLTGNLKKWKKGTLTRNFKYNGKEGKLSAERISSENGTQVIRFRWNVGELSFSEVIEASGHIPLPPYINRSDENEDSVRYQTIFSEINGSVAAPTAGLHFTEDVLEALSEKGIKQSRITLHIGAGTFHPVRNENVTEHEMHCEHFFVNIDTINELINNAGKIVAVGTTSVRTLESLYWLGVKVINGSLSEFDDLAVDQWEPYLNNSQVTVKDSLEALKYKILENNSKIINAYTRLIIIPGYRFKMIQGIITNFHMPRSTLLLLVSAFTGRKWKDIYNYALKNGFRFLSYGDCSLLFLSQNTL
jgi:S-adenosylmethionine:tRNA ribosyltransferase-isomerase